MDNFSQNQCENCGNVFSEDSKFCTICGAPVSEKDEKKESTVAKPTAEEVSANEQPPQPKNPPYQGEEASFDSGQEPVGREQQYQPQQPPYQAPYAGPQQHQQFQQPPYQQGTDRYGQYVPYPRPQQPPNYGQQPPYQPPNYTQQATSQNSMAMVGFIMSLVSVAAFMTFVPQVLGLIFSIMGLNQTNKTGQKGKGLAIAGIVIASIMMVVMVICAIFYAASYDSYWKHY